MAEFKKWRSCSHVVVPRSSKRGKERKFGHPRLQSSMNPRRKVSTTKPEEGLEKKGKKRSEYKQNIGDAFQMVCRIRLKANGSLFLA